MKVRDVIRLLETDGWYQVHIRGQPQAIQASGEAWDGNGGWTFRRLAWHWYSQQHSSTSGAKEMEHPIVVEKTETGFSAYSPDVPGCVATGRTVAETEVRMKEAIEFHIDGLKQEGLAVPQPSTKSAYVEVTA